MHDCKTTLNIRNKNQLQNKVNALFTFCYLYKERFQIPGKDNH